MQLTISVPKFTQFTLNKNLNELTHAIKLNTALMLFKNAKFSIEQASQFANLSLYEFITKCKENNISIAEYNSKELENDLNTLKNL
jgi:predicted HTH domain antitoxin